MTQDLKILDCSLRDGGYYCNWDYPDTLVRRYLDGVAQAGIPWVEIGFRSKPKGGFAGKFKFSKDNLLRELFVDKKVRLAVMIDGKDFIEKGGQIDRAGLKALFRPKKESPVELVRITTTRNSLSDVLKVGELVKELGYAVSVNVMQAGMLSPREIGEIAKATEPSPVDILYLADSFGALTPELTRELFLALRNDFSRTIGFHSHDNLGLALANSVAAWETGAEMIDCSLLGMGRGAGNLRTEQFLLYLWAKKGSRQLDPAPLFDVVLSDFAELHTRYQWGPSLPYMLAAVYNVHPMYPQRLLQIRRYAPMEVIRGLENLNQSGRGSSFSEESLLSTLKEHHSHVPNSVAVTELKNYRSLPPARHVTTDRPFLLLGSGPSTRERARDINEFIKAHKPIVLECNIQPGIDVGTDHFTLFTNSWRLEENRDHLTPERRVVLGMTRVGSEMVERLLQREIYHYPYRVLQGQFDAGDHECVIPFDVVSMFAFAFALRTGAASIYLCGFDGYVGEAIRNGGALEERIAMEREMEGFLRIFKEHKNVKGKIRIVSLTPTVFEIEKESLYAYI